jgi:hypothetical protein
MQEIVIDKSFLDGSKAASVDELCRTHHALMTEELFFELITTSHEKGRRAFRKLPDIANPVSLIPNVGTLLRFESETGRPSAPLLQHRIAKSFQFNSRLRDGTFLFQGAYVDELSSLRKDIGIRMQRFINRCFEIQKFFPELSETNTSDISAVLAETRRSIATDMVRVRKAYGLLTANHGDERLPDPSLINPGWAWFHWVQTQLVAALRIFARYQGKMPSPVGSKFWDAAEHTMLDSYYVLFGSLCGGLASRDREIQEDFKLLRPNGLLLE